MGQTEAAKQPHIHLPLLPALQKRRLHPSFSINIRDAVKSYQAKMTHQGPESQYLKTEMPFTRAGLVETETVEEIWTELVEGFMKPSNPKYFAEDGAPNHDGMKMLNDMSNCVHSDG